MPDRLPPLTALRAFEAAARHMSFARAADELNVTPAALSFQIKSLETHLGRPVFRRLNRALELTEAGTALLPGTRDGFAALAAAWRNARRVSDPRHLTVTAGPAFTAIWLAPRMFEFAEAHPDIDLRFVASLKLLDLDRDDVDVAIRFGEGHDPGLWSRPLVADWMTPMMAPALAEGLAAPEALLEMRLFHQEDLDFLTPRADWRAWFAAAGVEVRDVAGPHFSQADHAIDAAIAGAGVVLGRGSLGAPALADGRLVAPFPMALALSAQYRFLCAPGAEARPQIAAFRDWIERETAVIDTLAARHSLVPVPTLP